jgi:V8-like Glu-specific endopeptidase
MWKDEFLEIQNWIAAAELEPALRKIDNISQSVREAVGAELALTSKILLARFNALALNKVKGVLSSQDERQESNRLLSDTLGYCNMLERRVTNLLPPARGQREVGGTAATILQPQNTLEVLIRGSQLRKIAWLERGIAAARSVCKIETSECVGTGFILRGGLLVTNNHVLATKQAARETVAIFNFQQDEHDRPLEIANIYLDPDRAFATSVRLDCTLVPLKGPELELQRWGNLTIHERPKLDVGSLVSVIQHPDGAYKQIALLGGVRSYGDDRMFYETSTMPGSSGAPVFDDDWNVVALHRGGGTWSSSEKLYTNNVGIQFASIRQAPELKHVLEPFACTSR